MEQARREGMRMKTGTGFGVVCNQRKRLGPCDIPIHMP
jgi:hypothetical protein